VIGREFDISVLARLAEVDEDPLLDLMTPRSPPRCSSRANSRTDIVRACVIQHSLYDELSPTRRARAHQRIATTLENRHHATDPALLPSLPPLDRPPAERLDKALHYARLAGDAARGRARP